MISRQRRIVFAVATTLISTVLCVAALFAVDVWEHRKFDRSAGLNIWGYRGRRVGRKQAHETRIVVLGGSTVQGFGLAPEDSFPSQLEALLNRDAVPPARYSV